MAHPYEAHGYSDSDARNCLLFGKNPVFRGYTVLPILLYEDSFAVRGALPGLLAPLEETKIHWWKDNKHFIIHNISGGKKALCMGSGDYGNFWISLDIDDWE